MPQINLTIISSVTFVTSAGAIIGNSPQFQTLRDLEGRVQVFVPPSLRALVVESPQPYEFNTRTTSTSQRIILFNFGNSPLTITGVDFTTNGVQPVLNTAGEFLKNTVTVIPGVDPTTGQAGFYPFDLSYYAEKPGTFNNFFTIRSDDNFGSALYSVPTTQIVSREYDYYIEPLSSSSIVLDYSGTTSTRFTIYPTDSDVTILDFDPVIQSISPGFSVEKVSGNSFDLIFSANKVTNVNSTYTAEVSVMVRTSARGRDSIVQLSTIVNSEVTLNIDYDQYEHYADWISAGSYNNSIIGVSYDKILGQKYITIGIGAGADGSSEYAQGGAGSISIAALGVTYSVLNLNYPNWNQVYRIPISDSAATYTSKDWAVKTSGVDYGSYFGEYGRYGSMFIVENDGYDNIKITLNKLRELSGDESVDITLDNLSRAFYYYSETDLGGGRITQLGYPQGDGTQTELFTGFNSLGEVTTQLVAYEKSS